ncbi:MAG: 16S rRNA (guanine(966)-N(2))-methyltransferase RsmD [Clostridiaceae bacterium]|nr:16S rRNA (guanine(966)-N(2))-methyltransferase RsmD [Clostridiaceae bacterium]
MPRVVAGRAGGIRLETNNDKLMRPTSDRMKEAIFSSIQSEIDQGEISFFLDLFAGSGQIGIEALSRGVPNVIFVENNKRAQQIINKNFEKTKLRGKLLPISANRAVEQLAKQGQIFDIIYFDPPWMLLNEIWQEIEQNLGKLLSENGKILIEHSKTIKLELDQNKWNLIKEKRYGQSVLVVIEKKLN